MTAVGVNLDVVRARLRSDRDQLLRLEGAADRLRTAADDADREAACLTSQRASLLTLLAPKAAAGGQATQFAALLAEFELDAPKGAPASAASD